MITWLVDTSLNFSLQTMAKKAGKNCKGQIICQQKFDTTFYVNLKIGKEMFAAMSIWIKNTGEN